MSRRVLADLVGRSEEWLRQIENGQRRLDSIEYAIRISEVLGMSDLTSALGLRNQEAPRALRLASAVAPLRDAILSSAGTDMFVERRRDHPQVTALEQDVAEAWASWSGYTNRYQRTLRLLPELIHGAAARTREATAVASIEPAVSAYHLARTVLSRMGEEQLSWIMADRALGAAGRIGGSALLAAAWHGAVCYLRQGCFREAHRLAVAAVADRRPADTPPATALVLGGALRLVAAEAAAGMLDAEHAYQLLDEARRIAREVEDDIQPHMVPFGATEVGISSVQVAIRLGRSSEAIRLASEVDIPDEYAPDRQARFYIPLAFLYARRNEDAAAVFALNKVAAISPEDIRYDELSHRSLHRLLRRNNLTIRRELTRLADLAGIG